MTTAKAFRQKGTGRARAGALSVPQRIGGGAAFGPKPRRYTVKVNRKARRRALRAALSAHAEQGTIAIFDGTAYSEPSTKQAAKALDAWGQASPTLVVLGPEEAAAAKSFRNLSGVNVLVADSAGVADVAASGSIVISEAALDLLVARAGGKG
jgi:large subunit ribosomal protein L4